MANKQVEEEKERHRIDLWLKQVCLYKSRSEATDDCNGGKVRLNGHRTKAAADIKENDVIEISKGGNERKFVVLIVPPKQLDKEKSKEAYRDESPAPPAKDDLFAGAYSAPKVARGEGRPTKKDRRDMDKGGARRG